MSAQPLSCIILPTTKKTNEYKNLVAGLARADAHHDLGKLFKNELYTDNSKVRNAFNSGIPVPAVNTYSEAGALAASILRANCSDKAIDGNVKQLALVLDAVPDCTLLENVNPCIFDVGTNNETFFQYNVVKFIMKCENNKERDGLKEIADKAIDNFGQNFVTNTKLGENNNEAAFIVDFSQHHFIENLTKGIANDNFTIHYLMTPEVVNDPAGKPNIHNKNLFGLHESRTRIGVKLHSYIQTDMNDISYTKFEPNDPSPLNNFFSNYTFTLSPVRQVYTKGKADRLISSLNISYDNGNGPKPLTDPINDSKGENSITSVIGYLKKILPKLTGSAIPTPSTNFEFSSKCQQKRSGDWLQALACLDVKNREFTRILPPPEVTGAGTKINKMCPVYLVTHDQIELAYALLNGVNIIYLDFYGRIYVFKNNADPAVKGSGKSVENILFDGLKSKWMNMETGVSNDDYNKLLLTAINYNDDRLKYLEELKIEFDKLSSRLVTSIEGLNFTNVTGNIKENTNVIKTYQLIVDNSLKQLFQNAVKIMFANLNLIDITNDLKNVKENIGILSMTTYEDGLREYVDTFNKSINTLNKSINNVKGVQDRFGSIVKEPMVAFINVFKNWVDVNVAKLDVYKAAKLDILQQQPSDTRSFISRISSFFNTTNIVTDERTVDSHIFLPFIENIDSYYKNQIIDILTILMDKNKSYYDVVLGKPTELSRGARISPSVLFYNRVANLIYESLIFLKTTAVKGDGIEKVYSTAKDLIVEKMSTDNILIADDVGEQQLFESDGKYSNFTENVTDKQASTDEQYITGGTSYIDSFSYYTPGSSGANISSVVCNISRKQVLWPLITSLLLESNTKEKIENFKARITAYVSDMPDEESRANKIRDDSMVSSGGADSLDISTNEVAISFDGLANSLHEKISANIPSNSNDNLMLDFSLGFHPLVPIYGMLTAYFSVLGNKSADDPFFYTYFTYINVLEKMKEIIETNYLGDVNNAYKTAAAYLIGFGLNIMLINSNTSLLQTNEISRVVDMSRTDYLPFSLKNDSFAGLFSGAIIQPENEEAQGISFINNIIFKQFLTNEVGFKQIMEQGTSVDNLPGCEELRDRILNLMKQISVKVNADRGATFVASGITGLTLKESKERAERSNETYEEKRAKGLLSYKEKRKNVTDAPEFFKATTSSSPSNDVELVEISSSKKQRIKGGEKSYKQKKHKKKTRKYNRSYKNKTQKRRKMRKITIRNKK